MKKTKLILLLLAGTALLLVADLLYPSKLLSGDEVFEDTCSVNPSAPTVSQWTLQDIEIGVDTQSEVTALFEHELRRVSHTLQAGLFGWRKSKVCFLRTGTQVLAYPDEFLIAGEEGDPGITLTLVDGRVRMISYWRSSHSSLDAWTISQTVKKYGPPDLVGYIVPVIQNSRSLVWLDEGLVLIVSLRRYTPEDWGLGGCFLVEETVETFGVSFFPETNLVRILDQPFIFDFYSFTLHQYFNLPDYWSRNPFPEMGYADNWTVEVCY